jgi:rhamnose utilization protein RhaD (predicted bifunctional aldolase and dehydrogenase)
MISQIKKKTSLAEAKVEIECIGSLNNVLPDFSLFRMHFHLCTSNNLDIDFWDLEKSNKKPGIYIMLVS